MQKKKLGIKSAYFKRVNKVKEEWAEEKLKLIYAMTDTKEILFNQLRTIQDKFTYFLLAVAGSAIAFSIQEITDKDYSQSLIPLGIAILSWGVSFYYGCCNIRYVASSMYANYELIRVQNGEHSNLNSNPSLIEAASAGIKEAIHINAEKVGKYSTRQFQILILGAIFYIGWQILEMYLRSIN